MDRETIRTAARRRTLDVFFNPRNVAVIGATEAAHSVGLSILANLKNVPFPGAIWPERGFMHSHPRLEPLRDGRFQRLHLGRLDAGRRLG